LSLYPDNFEAGGLMTEAVRTARENGIVGAGGAAFPTHVKLASKADVMIANAAECEPLLYKDEEILRHFPDLFMKGLTIAASAVGAQRIVIGIKDKHPDLVKMLRDRLPRSVEIGLLRDTYPSGDEFLLVRDLTGRQIPRGGIPIDVGTVVQNVETLYNLGAGAPLVEKFVTISGEVDEALTLKVPIGMSWRNILQALRIGTEGKGFILGGPMMGTVIRNLGLPVTKADSGLVILPSGHSLLVKKSRTETAVRKIAYSCDQCMRCSDLCPRDLLGHGVKPHRAMISVTMGATEKLAWNRSALYCCECALCTLYACPEDLDPFRVMVESKKQLLRAGERPLKGHVENNPMYKYRRTPTKMLVRRLGLEEFVRPHRYIEKDLRPEELAIPLSQHRGSPAVPVVRKGQKVEARELIGEIPEGALGSRLFSPLPAVVERVDNERILLKVL
jgi:Na+-translocating ferredoxin:NAD+ oxidoreductase RnfC subunit